MNVEPEAARSIRTVEFTVSVAPAVTHITFAPVLAASMAAFSCASVTTGETVPPGPDVGPGMGQGGIELRCAAISVSTGLIFAAIGNLAHVIPPGVDVQV